MKNYSKIRIVLLVVILSFSFALKAHAATITVNSLLDDGDETCTSKCTLRDAVGLSHSGDIINFDSSLTSGGPATITLTEGYISIDHSVSITGPDSEVMTIDGNSDDQMFLITNFAGTINISNLTFANGHGNAGYSGVIDIGNGGSINLNIDNSSFSNNTDGNEYASVLYVLHNSGNIVITNSTFTDNISTDGYGGAIFIEDSEDTNLTITDSTFSGNSSEGNGGAIYSTNSGDLIITNSTFTENISAYDGGAIFIDKGDLTITSSTFNGNTAADYGGAIQYSSDNGETMEIINSTFANNVTTGSYGVINGYNDDATTIITNSTFYNNTGADGYGVLTLYNNTSVITNSIFASDSLYSCDSADNHSSGGHNIVSDDSCEFAAEGDLNSTNALLDHNGLQDNGGPVETVALYVGSPAINAGDDEAAPELDARGISRPKGAHSDIGAYEGSIPYESIIVDSLLDDEDPCSEDKCTLRAAIALAGDGDTVEFEDGLDGTILLGSSIIIYHNITITGPGQDELTIDFSDDSNPGFDLRNDGTFNVSGFTFTNAYEPVFEGLGGDDSVYNISNSIFTHSSNGYEPVYATAGNYNIDNVTFSDNNPNDYAGAVYFDSSGDLTITNSTFINNDADNEYAGAVYTYQSGTVTIDNTTFTGNTNAIASAIYPEQTEELIITNSTFDSNTDGQVVIYGDGTATLTNTTFANNVSSVGTFSSSDTTNIINSTFYNNINGDGNYTLLKQGGIGIFNVVNSILYSEIDDNCSSNITSLGHNIDSGTSCEFAGEGDLSSTDPLLDPEGLKDNKGDVETIALLKGSPAIDAGDATVAPETDARGINRTHKPDIGAYEFIPRQPNGGGSSSGAGAQYVAVAPVSEVAPVVPILPVPACTILSNLLKQGSRGADVKCLQTILKITSDGIFGPMTKAAVIVFQKAHSLTPDGVVGPKTRAALGVDVAL